MKKKNITNLLLKAIVVLAIILVGLISFLGIHERNLNSWENILPEYQLSKDLSEIRIFGFIVDDSTEEVETTAEDETTEETTEEEETTDTIEETDAEETTDETTDDEEETTTVEVPVNDESILTAENYRKTKSIVEKRLKEFGIEDYTVIINEETGDLSVSVPYSTTTDYTVSLITAQGDIQVIDTDTEEVLIDKSMIKSVSAYYSQSDSSTDEELLYDMGIKLEFTSEGQTKLNEILKTYIETTDEDGETTQKTVTVRIDDEDKYITYFSTEGTYTYLAIPLYSAVSAEDTEAINSDYTDCMITKTIVSSDTLPIIYELSTGTYVEATSNENLVTYLVIAIAAILIVVAIVLICKYKKNGILMALIEFGYIGIILLLLRAATVTISLSGLIALTIVALINYLLMIMMMAKQEKQLEISKQFLKFILTIIPFIITAIVFAFSTNTDIKSVGNVSVWGIIGFVYTFLVSLVLFKNTNNKNSGKE